MVGAYRARRLCDIHLARLPEEPGGAVSDLQEAGQHVRPQAALHGAAQLHSRRPDLILTITRVGCVFCLPHQKARYHDVVLAIQARRKELFVNWHLYSACVLNKRVMPVFIMNRIKAIGPRVLMWLHAILQQSQLVWST